MTSLTTKLCCSLCIKVINTVIYVKHDLNSFAQVSYRNKVRIANILFYFFLRFGDSWYPLAMINLFSKPEEDILSESSGTVYLCNEHNGVAVVSITAIHSIV
jgi:hypothetical protein